MNILGALTVFIICTIIGVLTSNKVKNSQKELEQILLMSQKIRAYLKSERVKTKQIIEKLCADKSFLKLPFLRHCLENFAYSKPFCEIWCESIDKVSDNMATEKSQLQSLYVLGEILGDSDETTQQNSLTMFENLIDASLQIARENTKNKGNLYRSLGLLCGIGFAVIVI